jgi:hypothetical protein
MKTLGTQRERTTKPTKRRSPTQTADKRRRTPPLLEQTAAPTRQAAVKSATPQVNGYEDLITAASPAPRFADQPKPSDVAPPGQPVPDTETKAPEAPTIRRSEKMSVSTPHDPAEREARSISKQVAAEDKGQPRAVKAGQKPVAAASQISRSHTKLDAEEERLGPAAKTKIQRATEPQAKDEGNTDADPAVVRRIQALRGQGEPIADDARSAMETRFGERFGAVRIHSNSEAHSLSERLQAEAFTVGNDIFFASGKYNPSSTAGRALLAHELTHVLQVGSADADAIHREASKDAGISVETSKFEGAGWALDLSAKTITVPTLTLPQLGGVIKGSTGSKVNSPEAQPGFSYPQIGTPFKLPPPGSRGAVGAYLMWENHIQTQSSARFESMLSAQFAAQKDAAKLQVAGAPFYVLTNDAEDKKSKTMFLTGTPEELSRNSRIVRPMLGPKGGTAPLDVDHILEIQLGGADSVSNMWMLSKPANRSSGSSINQDIDRSIKSALDAAKVQIPTAKGGKKSKGDNPLPDPTAVRKGWTITFTNIIAAPDTTRSFWSREQIEAGEHLRHFRALNEAELIAQGFKTASGERPKFINVFPNPDGGRVMRFDFTESGGLKAPEFFFKGYSALDVPAVPWPLPPDGTMFKIQVQKHDSKKKTEDGTKQLVRWTNPAEIEVRNDPSLGFGGFITPQSVTAAFRNAEFTPLCPIDFPDVNLGTDGELTAQGNIASSAALLPGLQIPIQLSGSEIFVSFPVPTDRLDFGILRVTDASLELGVDEESFFIRGAAGIEVHHVGRGTLTATGSDNDVKLAGDFAVDLDFLDPAQVHVEYSLTNDELSGNATLGVKQGALPGISSGSVKIEMSRNTLAVAGSLKLGGIFQDSVATLAYNSETGLVIEGNNLPLPLAKLPGVKDATASIRVAQDAVTGAWSVSGGGQAAFAAAGAQGTLGVDINGDAVTLKGRAEVNKGPAKGWLEVMGTNRAIDDKGNPIEGGQVGAPELWGKGEATVGFGKVLTGTAGLELTPAGKVVVSGELALPPTIDLFERREFSKSLFSMSTPDFPIWGVKLGPVGVGIFAFADAQIRFDAHVGPGQLRDTNIKATLDLDNPSGAQVDGKAKLVVPAYAGMALDIGGGLKAQLANVYAKGRVGIDGTLGVATEAALDVAVKWNMNQGLAFAAKAEVTAQPKFEVGINASLSAGIDLWLGKIEKTWGPWRKKLGEFGPNMELGASLPIKWSENDGLDFNLDNVEVKRPQIDAQSLLKDTFKTLV